MNLTTWQNWQYAVERARTAAQRGGTVEVDAATICAIADECVITPAVPEAHKRKPPELPFLGTTK